MPDPSQHADNRNFVESILRYIPGFKGYLEKDYRQESDHLLRTHMADRLQQSKSGLNDFMRVLAEAARLDDLPQCERVRVRLDKLISEIRAAVRGYSGFFDFVKVDEQLLDRVYDFDMSLAQEVGALAAEIEGVSAKPDIPSDIMPQLLRQIDSVEKKWHGRDDLLKGVAD